jgi:putative DNA primase/helicase
MLVPLDTIAWMRAKRQLKAVVPVLHLNDLQKAVNELRQQAAQEAKAFCVHTEPEAAAALAEQWHGVVAYGETLQRWRGYGQTRPGVWDILSPVKARAKVEGALPDILSKGFSATFAKGVLTLLEPYLCRTFEPIARHFLPFTNGVLQLDTMTLLHHDAAYGFTWSLPYPFFEIPAGDNPAQHCPKTLAFLHEATRHKSDVVQLLRAIMKATVRGKVEYQRFLELIGPGGSGKGTFIRLLQCLVGTANSASTELTRLESSRFETYGLIKKRLIVITDQKAMPAMLTA